MNYMDDTIAAIASGYGQSGIGIIRVSGANALAIVNDIFVPVHAEKKVLEMKSYTALYGHIMREDNIIDECIILYMKGPHSYTGEDVVEIDSHGGLLVCSKILDYVCEKGARPAEPGEFSKRAFINGRMDLSQAEAVMDVIHADTDKMLEMSVRQLNGELKNAIRKMRKIIIHENAYIEYALDDPEHVSLNGYPKHLKEVTKEVLDQIDEMLAHSKEGRLLREGIKTVIVGKPNAGKSSLLNNLLGEERAIVTQVAGTTRDTLEERAVIDGIPLNIVDTAGIHETEDVVEKIGVDKAKKVIAEADLILYVVDQTCELDEEDKKIRELIKEKPVIVLLNKSDLLKEKETKLSEKDFQAPCIYVSMKQKTNMNVLKEKIKELFFHGEIETNEAVFVNNERHKQSLLRAKESLLRVIDSIDSDMPEDFYTIDLLDAYEQLGYIIGESVSDDLVNEIFAEFCTGK